ncbi:MAG TPA: hypothetical protein VFH56_00135 [Acidimicrobiales bacterium]|nr:hypothetical protein [Acidimicrobiales bacterium]
MPYRIVPLNWIQWLTLLLLLAIAVVTPIEFARIHDVQHHQNDAIQSIMCFAEKRTVQNKQLPPKQRRQTLRFFEQALANAHLTPCPPVP